VDWRESPLIETWWGEGKHPFCALLRIPLLPFSVLYGAAMAGRRAAFERGLLPTLRLEAPTISVGNITAGGTGKSPMVRFLAQRLVDAGRRPLVFSSGFGSPADSGSLDEEGAALARAVPGARVLQAPDARRALARVFEAPDPPGAVVLDDGFQKLALRRDLDVVMIDATRPFGSGLPIPAGALREWPGALSRADVVVISRTELADPAAVDALRKRIAGRAPRAAVIRQRHEPARLVFSGREPATLRGVPVWLVSAIAHPRAFEETVKSLGAKVLGHDAFRDHAPMPRARVEQVLGRAKAAGAGLVLASAKDAPKLDGFRSASPPVDALDIAVAFADDPAPLLDRLDSLFEREVNVPAL
jgi:tetraacyldisaccharide 4'-kinase